MCGFCNVYNCPFKWITYLVVAIGIFTFLFWLLAVPLLYFHFYECCNEKWSTDWIVWFLAIAFVSWFIISMLIVLISFCLRFFKENHLNESNVHLTGQKACINSERQTVEKAKAFFFEKNKVDILNDSMKSIGESPKEIVCLPKLESKDSFTVVQMNDEQGASGSCHVSGSEFPIPMNETQHYVQSEPTLEPEKEVKSPKTPREIFFKDLIESAPSYFDFDPKKISEDLKKKYESEKSIEKVEGEENNYFLGSHEEKPNVTSEVQITLNEKGLVVDEPIILGNFQILKD